MKINIKKLREDAVIPEYKTRGAAGFDLTALEEITFAPGEVKSVPIGLAIDVGDGYQLELRNRSSMVLNTPLRLANSPATIDADYRGEIGVILEHVNNGVYKNSFYTIKKGHRIAQGVVMPAIQADIAVVDELSVTERNTGGFGSTGK